MNAIDQSIADVEATSARLAARFRAFEIRFYGALGLLALLSLWF